MAAEFVFQLLLVLAASPIEVESVGACPSAAEVETQLRRLLPSANETGADPDRAVIVEQENLLHVTLVLSDGSAIVDRQIAAEGSCADRANALAVVIAAWHAEMRAGLPPPPTLAEKEPPLPMLVSTTFEAVPQVIGSMAGADLAAGAGATAGIWRRAWGLILSTSGTTLRDGSLGYGRAGWTRFSAGIGPGRRFGWRGLHFDVRAEALAGFVFARGTGYPIDKSAASAAPGLGGTVAVSRVLFGHFVLSLGVGGNAWPLAQTLVVDPDRSVRERLPRFEARVAAGLGFSFQL